ncbi:uncharacterized protein HKW66_Vig0017870 [Vigna angularis]|uniref:Uncharacterized protein n=1 Tax=Phaseolus angularis TaxID=3914 RepID=A0A8T0LAB3_PHAAN|nr:uncharacterized protein HKW66_Vig0017870 [Vigna angularis]
MSCFVFTSSAPPSHGCCKSVQICASSTHKHRFNLYLLSCFRFLVVAPPLRVRVGVVFECCWKAFLERRGGGGGELKEIFWFIYSKVILDSEKGFGLFSPKQKSVRFRITHSGIRIMARTRGADTVGVGGGEAIVVEQPALRVKRLKKDLLGSIGYFSTSGLC